MSCSWHWCYVSCGVFEGGRGELIDTLSFAQCGEGAVLKPCRHGSDSSWS